MTDHPKMRNNVFGSAVLACAVCLVPALSSGVLGQTTASQTSQPAEKVQPLPLSLIQKLRAFLGVNPPVAVGGSRSGGAQSVCLLSPWPSPDRKGDEVLVNVFVSKPVLLVSGQLNEIRIEKGKEVLLADRADSVRAIEGLIPWPIKPLQPGEKLTLKVRPRGAPGGDFATFTLRVADAQVLAANELQAKLLGDDSEVWSRYLVQLSPEQAATKAGLLSSPQAPANLRQILQCSER